MDGIDYLDIFVSEMICVEWTLNFAHLFIPCTYLSNASVETTSLIAFPHVAADTMLHCG